MLAALGDDEAAAFADDLACEGPACLVTCLDLASAPLNLCHPEFGTSTITLKGKTLRLDRITGIVNLLAAVRPEELLFYDEAEREYQAAEIHALLSFLLASVKAPVVDRATAGSLSGPFPNPLGWRRLAQQLGLPVAAIDIDSADFRHPFGPSAGLTAVDVACVGGCVVTPTGTDADGHTLALARAGGVEHLRASYLRDDEGRLRLQAAHATPDHRSAATRAALARYFAAARR